MGSSMPITPRVGMAEATIIMKNTTISSPRRRAHPVCRRRSSGCMKRSSRKRAKKAAGVEELSPMRLPRISMLP